MLEQAGFIIKPVQTYHIISDFGARDYTPDIEVIDPNYGQEFIVEIDGESHADRTLQDGIRDLAFRKLGKPTIRFTVEEVIGFMYRRKRLGAMTEGELMGSMSKALIAWRLIVK